MQDARIDASPLLLSQGLG